MIDIQGLYDSVKCEYPLPLPDDVFGVPAVLIILILSSGSAPSNWTSQRE